MYGIFVIAAKQTKTLSINFLFCLSWLEFISVICSGEYGVLYIKMLLHSGISTEVQCDTLLEKSMNFIFNSGLELK